MIIKCSHNDCFALLKKPLAYRSDIFSLRIFVATMGLLATLIFIYLSFFFFGYYIEDCGYDNFLLSITKKIFATRRRYSKNFYYHFFLKHLFAIVLQRESRRRGQKY